MFLFCQPSPLLYNEIIWATWLMSTMCCILGPVFSTHNLLNSCNNLGVHTIILSSCYTWGTEGWRNLSNFQLKWDLKLFVSRTCALKSRDLMLSSTAVQCGVDFYSMRPTRPILTRNWIPEVEAFWGDPGLVRSSHQDMSSHTHPYLASHLLMHKSILSPLRRVPRGIIFSSPEERNQVLFCSLHLVKTTPSQFFSIRPVFCILFSL